MSNLTKLWKLSIVKNNKIFKFFFLKSTNSTNTPLPHHLNLQNSNTSDHPMSLLCLRDIIHLSKCNKIWNVFNSIYKYLSPNKNITDVYSIFSRGKRFPSAYLFTNKPSKYIIFFFSFQWNRIKLTQQTSWKISQARKLDYLDWAEISRPGY